MNGDGEWGEYILTHKPHWIGPRSGTNITPWFDCITEHLGQHNFEFRSVSRFHGKGGGYCGEPSILFITFKNGKESDLPG